MDVYRNVLVRSNHFPVVVPFLLRSTQPRQTPNQCELSFSPASSLVSSETNNIWAKARWSNCNPWALAAGLLNPGKTRLRRM